jgi:hypothetical protein
MTARAIVRFSVAGELPGMHVLVTPGALSRSIGEPDFLYFPFVPALMAFGAIRRPVRTVKRKLC